MLFILKGLGSVLNLRLGIVRVYGVLCDMKSLVSSSNSDSP